MGVKVALFHRVEVRIAESLKSDKLVCTTPDCEYEGNFEAEMAKHKRPL